MSVGGAAKRYAQAAFSVAKEHDKLDEWEQELTQLTATLGNPESEEFFEHPAVPVEAKQAALNTMITGSDQQAVRNLMLLLLERDRLQQLPQIVEVFHALVLEDRGVVIANVVTAVELQPDELELIRARLRQMVGKEIQISTGVDPEIIGGIVVRIGDMLLDGSVRTQLKQLRQRMAR
ncbi:MAG TPA: F0F1 ATP synthase subunit delta [Nitrolancea sp.]|jgi:F-type H+-transporting ATPase subunit delta|nr:F0F1 ATP synthase subunit delta [Nitrolancea sp.]